MAWHYEWTTSYWALGNYDSENVLDNALMANDGILQYFPNSTHNSRAAVIGNLCLESTGINPGQWEGDGNFDPSTGFGVAQWTPSTKFTDWLGSTAQSDMVNGDKQIQFLCENSEQWSTSEVDMETGYAENYDLYVPILETMEDFFNSNESIEDLTTAWMIYWERPSYDPTKYAIERRIEYANYFDPLLPDKRKKKKHRLPIWMYPSLNYKA